MCFLVILGLLMGWLSPPDAGEGQASNVLRQEPVPLPIPEFLLRPELIPVKEPDDTPVTADKYVRWWSRMYAGGARR